MSAGLFALICPQCAGELEIDLHGTATCVRCARCARAYLNRFGHLIPIDSHDFPLESPGDPSTLTSGRVGRGGA